MKYQFKKINSTILCYTNIASNKGIHTLNSEYNTTVKKLNYLNSIAPLCYYPQYVSM
jgi:hypothetical protein